MPDLIRCPYCGAFDLDPYAVRIREHFPHYLRTICKNCGLIFANPQASSDELETFYKSYYDKGNFQGWKDKVKRWKADCDLGKVAREHQEVNRVGSRIFDNASRYIPQRLRWLEIGAGLGELSYLAKQRGFRVAATDLDSDAIGFMQAVMGIEHAYLGDIRHLPSQGDRYDIVVIHHVLEHVKDLFGTLSIIYQLLDPGGMLFVGVPNISSWGYKLHRGLSFLTFRIPDIVEGLEHTFGFTPKTLGRCLAKNNFEVKSIRTFGKGDTSKEMFDILRARGPQKALIALAESFFHTKMECVAVKPAHDPKSH